MSMRRTRSYRRSFIDLRRITIGDYVVLVSALLATVSLFLPWLVYSAPNPRSESAFTYSEVVAVVVIVFFLATILLVFYPALSPDLRLPTLPVSTPLIFLVMGGILLLAFTYELGKYDCIECQGLTSRGVGVWVAFISAFIFLLGGVIKWGARPQARRG